MALRQPLLAAHLVCVREGQKPAGAESAGPSRLQGRTGPGPANCGCQRRWPAAGAWLRGLGGRWRWGRPRRGHQAPGRASQAAGGVPRRDAQGRQAQAQGQAQGGWARPRWRRQPRPRPPLWPSGRQCDNAGCQKWRKLPPGTKIDENNPWCAARRFCCRPSGPSTCARVSAGGCPDRRVRSAASPPARRRFCYMNPEEDWARCDKSEEVRARPLRGSGLLAGRTCQLPVRSSRLGQAAVEAQLHGARPRPSLEQPPSCRVAASGPGVCNCRRWPRRQGAQLTLLGARSGGAGRWSQDLKPPRPSSCRRSRLPPGLPPAGAPPRLQMSTRRDKVSCWRVCRASSVAVLHQLPAALHQLAQGLPGARARQGCSKTPALQDRQRRAPRQRRPVRR